MTYGAKPPKEKEWQIGKTAERIHQLTKTSIELIVEERARQIREEGYTPDHDDDHVDNSIALAAACYAAPEDIFVLHRGQYFEAFPWNPKADKREQHNRIRQLTIAGALVLAEIDRLQRTELSQAKET